MLLLVALLLSIMVHINHIIMCLSNPLVILTFGPGRQNRPKAIRPISIIIFLLLK